MDFLIVIVLFAVLGLFIFFPNRFGRKRFENWILSKEPKPYALNRVVLNVLYFGCLGWTGYSVYKDIKGEEIRFGFFAETDFMWPYFMCIYFLFFYLTGLAVKRLEIDKKDKSNRIDYFKNKQQQQKEWIGKSM